MSKKDYKRIASALKTWRPSEETEQRLWFSIAEEIAGVLKEDNPRFDYARFYKACEA
jgi:hypothetical protein